MPGWIDADRPDRDGEWLRTHPAVDAFAQQVGVAGMTGVLLDHVHQHLTQADHSTVPVSPCHIETRRLLHEPLRQSHLLPPGRPGSGDGRRVGYGPVEGTVLILISPEQPRCVVACQPATEPCALDVGKVADKAEE